jgi:hypothetical protein
VTYYCCKILNRCTKLVYLKGGLDDIQVGVILAEIMLTKLGTDMLHNQVYGHMVVPTTWDDDVSILLCWQDEVLKCWLHKVRVL